MSRQGSFGIAERDFFVANSTDTERSYKFNITPDGIVLRIGYSANARNEWLDVHGIVPVVSDAYFKLTATILDAREGLHTDDGFYELTNCPDEYMFLSSATVPLVRLNLKGVPSLRLQVSTSAGPCAAHLVLKSPCIISI
jgi:hypothetical protein